MGNLFKNRTNSGDIAVYIIFAIAIIYMVYIASYTLGYDEGRLEQHRITTKMFIDGIK